MAGILPVMCDSEPMCMQSMWAHKSKVFALTPQKGESNPAGRARSLSRRLSFSRVHSAFDSSSNEGRSSPCVHGRFRRYNSIEGGRIYCLMKLISGEKTLARSYADVNFMIYSVSMAIENILAQLDSEIARLKQARALLATIGTGSATSVRKAGKTTAKGKPRKKRVLSADARKRIADAQRKRWAAVRAKAKKA